MKSSTIITIIILANLFWIGVISTSSMYISRAVIKSKQVYRYEFVQQLRTNVYAKNDQYSKFAASVDVARYNSWLVQMQWLYANGFDLWIPKSILTEEPIQQ